MTAGLWAFCGREGLYMHKAMQRQTSTSQAVSVLHRQKVGVLQNLPLPVPSSGLTSKRALFTR
jgi:hypothetical protein